MLARIRLGSTAGAVVGAGAGGGAPLTANSRAVGQNRPATVKPQRRAKVVTVFGVGGAALLGWSLSRRPGSKDFYTLTMGVAATWAAGAVLSDGRPPLWGGNQQHARTRSVLTASLIGVGAFGVFYGLAHAARWTPRLRRAIGRALVYEEQGSTPLVLLVAAVNATAEEMFFRGALWSAVQERQPILTTTLAYMAATAATRNPALVLAGGATGLLFGYQRRATGGILSPTVSHLTWSTLMLRYLPPLFRHLGP